LETNNPIRAVVVPKKNLFNNLEKYYYDQQDISGAIAVLLSIISVVLAMYET